VHNYVIGPPLYTMASPKKHRPLLGCHFVRSTVELLQGFALHSSATPPALSLVA